MKPKEEKILSEKTLYRQGLSNRAKDGVRVLKNDLRQLYIVVLRFKQPQSECKKT